MTEEQLSIVQETVAEAVKKTVNGKIDGLKQMLKNQNEQSEKFRERIDAHIERVEPVIVKYEESQAFNAEVSKFGKRAIFWAKVVGSIGVIVMAAKLGLIQLINWRQ